MHPIIQYISRRERVWLGKSVGVPPLGINPGYCIKQSTRSAFLIATGSMVDLIITLLCQGACQENYAAIHTQETVPAYIL